MNFFSDVEKIAGYICDNFLEKLDTGSLPDMSKTIIHFICGVIEVNSLEITTGEKLSLSEFEFQRVSEFISFIPKYLLLKHFIFFSQCR